MNFNDMDSIKANGFEGFRTIHELWKDGWRIPKVKGVYMVLRTSPDPPVFLHPGVGGFFKGNDPNITEEELKENWVAGALVVYIGKAGNPEGKATLYSRLDQYFKFGKGVNIGHYGGRLIWQLQDHADLIICWKKTGRDDPREIEKALIRDFMNEFGKRPFANLTG